MGRPTSTLGVKPCATPDCGYMIRQDYRYCPRCLRDLRLRAWSEGQIRVYVPLNGRYGPHTFPSHVDYSDRDCKPDLILLGEHSRLRRLRVHTQAII